MKALRVNDVGRCVECVECVVCVLGVTSGGGRSQSCGCCSISRPSAQSVDPGGGRRSSHVMFFFFFFFHISQTTVSCRIAVVMMQYSIMANSYWLLVEGIYLHNLLVITVFTERNYFKIYLCIGWGECKSNVWETESEQINVNCCFAI